MSESVDPGGAAPLATPLDELAYIIVKARAFDVQVDDSGLEEGSNAPDDREVGVFEPVGNAARAELMAAIEGLNEDALFELVALVLIGRGDFGGAEMAEAQAAARDIADRNLVTYLVETPLLGDLIDQGLAECGYAPLGD